MKTVSFAAGLVIAASAAMAHEGAHLHPHEAGTWLALLPAVALIAVAVIVARTGR